jgi:xanthine phosphoribosyltransferase
MIATPGPRKSFPLSWEELHRDAKTLAGHLLELGPWKGMVAVTRGGLAPAAIVARALDIRLIETVWVIGYEPDDYNPQQVNEVSIIKAPARVEDGEGWLVVDDLVDTGRTAEVLRKLMPKAHFAVIYAKPLGRPLVDTYVTEICQDTWIYLICRPQQCRDSCDRSPRERFARDSALEGGGSNPRSPSASGSW